jgi:hypothetical protein
MPKHRTKDILYFPDEDSVVTVGVADSTFDLSKHPGKTEKTVGWMSQPNLLRFNQVGSVIVSMFPSIVIAHGFKSQSAKQQH